MLNKYSISFSIPIYSSHKTSERVRDSAKLFRNNWEIMKILFGKIHLKNSVIHPKILENNNKNNIFNSVIISSIIFAI